MHLRHALLRQVLRAAKGPSTRSSAWPRERLRRIEFHHTPQHRSWLNIEESELNAPTHQRSCVPRFGDFKVLRQEVGVWAAEVDGRQQGVDHQMTVDDDCGKLKSGH